MIPKYVINMTIRIPAMITQNPTLAAYVVFRPNFQPLSYLVKD
jgi:hypothetical protein